ncbi:golgin subfamily A member 6-like protein 7 [Chrysoperla carnea]|uniref:golgin subfamily A member 6-like protein 7 n=1 Tax=Chrysoperla carnea TaxID=189513 RepID=UPI001D05D94F|nr:golgin subfamily A member 6-like protein 7 [Chrysoperla carnea]
MPYKTRQAVAQLIVTHPQLYTSTSLIQDLDLCLIWVTIQLLGNDFEESIRHKITCIATGTNASGTNSNSVMFESIRDQLFHMSCKILSTRSLDLCTVYLLSWITRCSCSASCSTSADIHHEHETDNADNYDSDEMTVFNKGDMNLYMEDIHLTKLSISTLQNVIFKQLVDKTPTQYILELLTNQEMISWFPNESKAATITLLNLLLKNVTSKQPNENQFNEIYKRAEHAENSLAHKLRREDEIYKRAEHAENSLAHKLRREDEIYKRAEHAENSLAHKLRREDEIYKRAEHAENSLAHKLRRKDEIYKRAEHAENSLAHKLRREDEIYKRAEHAENSLAHKLRREDEIYKRAEHAENSLAHKLRRKDEIYKRAEHAENSLAHKLRREDEIYKRAEHAENSLAHKLRREDEIYKRAEIHDCFLTGVDWHIKWK